METMKKIDLNCRTPKKAVVDDCDYEVLSQYKWFYNKGYAKRTAYQNGNGTHVKISMARAILNAPDNMDVDHINGDKLDNRRCNLRLVTRQQNNWNRISRPGSSSRFKGVSRRPLFNGKQWEARIVVDGKYYHLGRFVSEEDAARAFDEAAIKFHGEFARLNFQQVREAV